MLGLDWNLDDNYARTFIRGLDSELAAHGHVLFVRHGGGAPDSVHPVGDAIEARYVAVLHPLPAGLSGTVSQ